MPSTYAHYRFGTDIRKELPCREQETIDAYPEPYMIGLHGPDILFYYNALFSNPINATGFALHEKPGKIFLKTLKKPLHQAKTARPHYRMLTACYVTLHLT